MSEEYWSVIPTFARPSFVLVDVRYGAIGPVVRYCLSFLELAHYFRDRCNFPFLVSLYASPGVPSIPCDFLFSRSRNTLPMSCSAYSWLSHIAVSGSSVITSAILAFWRMSCRFQGACISPFPTQCRVCVLFLFELRSRVFLSEAFCRPFFPSFRRFDHSAAVGFISLLHRRVLCSGGCA